VYMRVLSAPESDTLYALNGQTGSVLWRQPGGFALTLTPYDHHLYVIFSAVQGGAPGRLVDYDATTGALRWHYALPGEAFTSSLVANGAIYLSGVQAMYALDVQNGVVRWHSAYSPNTFNIGGSLIADGNTVLAATPYGLRQYDGVTGAIRWVKNVQINDPGAVVAPNGLIYISTAIAPGGSPPQQIVAIDGTNGNQVWSFPYQSGLSPAGVSNGALFATTGSAPIALLALNLRTGDMLWQHNFDASVGQITDVQFYGSSIFCSTSADQVSAFSTTDGATEWSFTASGSNINDLLVG